MRNTFFLVLISLLLFIGLSCGEKEKAKPEKLPELSEQLPELPDFKKEPWQEESVKQPQFFLGGEEVKFHILVYFYHEDVIEDDSSYHYDNQVDVIQNAEGRGWFAFHVVRKDESPTFFHLFEFNEQGSEKFVQNLSGLTLEEIDTFVKENYDLEMRWR